MAGKTFGVSKKGVVSKKIGAQKLVTLTKDGKSKQLKGELLEFEGPPAEVKVGNGVVLSLGNYQTMRLSVDVSIPCKVEDMEATFKKGVKFVEDKLNKWVGDQALEVPKKAASQSKASEFDDGESLTDDDDFVLDE